MNKVDLKKPVSQDVSYGALLGLLLAVAFVVVIPALQAMQEMPMAYYYSLPVSQTMDTDNDGIADVMDGTPAGATDIVNPADEPEASSEDLAAAAGEGEV